MTLPINQQKISGYTIAALTVPCVLVAPSLPLALLVGAVGVASAGYAYSLTINSAKIAAELREVDKLKSELEARYSDAKALKAEVSRLKSKYQTELDSYKNLCEAEVLDTKSWMQSQFDKKACKQKEALEKDYLQKTKDYRSHTGC